MENEKQKAQELLKAVNEIYGADVETLALIGLGHQRSVNVLLGKAINMGFVLIEWSDMCKQVEEILKNGDEGVFICDTQKMLSPINGCVEVGGLTWAPENLKIGNKEYFTFEEAQKLCPKGWHVPTASEWMKLYENCDYHFDEKTKEGVFTDKKTGATLRLPAVGYRGHSSGVLYNQGVYGNCWSSTQSEEERGYSMSFNSSYVNPSNTNYKAGGFSVRCVRD